MSEVTILRSESIKPLKKKRVQSTEGVTVRHNMMGINVEKM